VSRDRGHQEGFHHGGVQGPVPRAELQIRVKELCDYHFLYLSKGGGGGGGLYYTVVYHFSPPNNKS
jgi:hypothetical protein